jgi:hypothetical protein
VAPDDEVRRPPPRYVPVLVACELAAGVGIAVTTDQFVTAAAVALVALVGAVALSRSRDVLPWFVAVLLLLGATRRWTEWKWGDAGGIDPLLAIQPAVTAVLLLVAARSGAFRQRSPLTSVVWAIVLIGVLGAVNPLQGSAAAGAVGAVIFLTPVAWFFVGRSVVDDRTLARVYAVVVAVMVVAALVGIQQADGTFFAFDRAWFESLEGYDALRVGGGVVRPFGFSSSAAEYGKNLGIGVVVCAAFWLRRGAGWRALALPAVGVLGTALLLAGLRTTLVLTVLGVALTWFGVRRRASVVRLALVGGVALVALVGAASVLAPGAGGDGSSAALASRNLGALANPLDADDSTLGRHVGQVVDALVDLPSNPLGLGTGSTTLAGKQFGESRSADMDLGDAALSLGVPGVIAYLVLLVRLVRRAVAVASARRDWLAAAALGVVVVSSLQWFNGGLYSAVTIAWLTFGWLDRPATTGEDVDDAAAADAGREPAPAATGT